MSVCPHPITSDYYADFIIRYEYRSFEELYERTGTHCIDFVSHQFAIAYVPLKEVEPISISRYPYASIPRLYGLLDTTALESSGISKAINQPSLKADGHGVLIGMIDTGIEYTNPLFRHTDGTSRILQIWDQTINSDRHTIVNEGDHLSPLYGTIYTKEQIDQALTSQTPYDIVPSRDTNGHGTFMAGVAAGNRIRQPTNFSGAAPKASLAIVKLKPAKQYLRDYSIIRKDAVAFQENDIMMGIRHLLDLARKLQMPLVIYLGVGTSQGGNNGTTPLELQLQEISGSLGISVVVGCGNEVGFRHHFFTNIPANREFEDVEIRVAENEPGFSLELWSSLPELFRVGFVSPAGQVIDSIPLSIPTEIQLPFVKDSTTITLNYRLSEYGSSDQLILIRFQTPSPGIWHIRVYPDLVLNRQFHMWLPMQGFISPETSFLSPDPNVTITGPGNAVMPITVAAYNHQSNSIYIHSSRGFTRSNATKPDLAAPGVNVQGPALLPEHVPLEPIFTTRTGTSVAAAITAGAVAGLYSWGLVDGNALNLNNSIVRALLIRGADRNPGLLYPNREWGYGTLNLYQALNI